MKIGEYRSKLAAENGGVDPYSDMTDVELASRLYDKHYSDMPRNEFYSKFGVDYQAPQGGHGPIGKPASATSRRAPQSSLTMDGSERPTLASALSPRMDDPRIAGPAARALDPAAAEAEDAADMAAARRLPGEIGKMTGAMYREGAASLRRAGADAAIDEANRFGDDTERFQEQREMDALGVPFTSKAQRGQPYRDADDILFEAEMAQGRAQRAGRYARLDAESAIDPAAGPGERALVQGGSSFLYTAPVVTLAAMVPGGQPAALTVLGGSTGLNRYYELIDQGVPEDAAALSGALFGGLESLTEAIPIGTLAKKSPFIQKASEFVVQDLLGENVMTVAQLADDFHQGLRDDVTMQDIQQAIQETSAATVVGAGAQVTVSQITQGIIDEANRRALARVPVLGEQDVYVPPPPVLGEDDVVSEQDTRQAEDITLEGDGELIPGEMGVEETQPSEEIELGADGRPVPRETAEPPVPSAAGRKRLNLADGFRRGGTSGMDVQEAEHIDYEGVPEPAEDEPLPKTAADRRANMEAKRQSIRVAFTGEGPDAGVTYIQGEHGWHGVAVRGIARAWVRNEQTARELVEEMSKEVASGNIDQAAAQRAELAEYGERPGSVANRSPQQALAEARKLEVGDVITTDDGDTLTITNAYPIGKSGKRGIQGRWDNGKIGTFEDEEVAHLLMPSRYTDANTGERKTGKPGQITKAKPQTFSQRAHEAASSPKNDRPEPTQKQLDAGNYKKGHVRVHGMEISIENPIGSIRRSKPDAPVQWERKITKGHYGYIRGTEDNTGEHVDVFVGPNKKSPRVYVIDQVIDGKFDEPKVMMGYLSEEAATKAYLANYQKGWKGLGAITEMNIYDFKKWVTSRKAKEPVSWVSPRDPRLDQRADRLTHMASRAGWQEIGGRVITDGDPIKPTVKGRTNWLPHEEWFRTVQQEAPLSNNKEGKATERAVKKALAGEKLTAAEDRHIKAMLDVIDAEDRELAELAGQFTEDPEQMSDTELNALEAKLERLAKQQADESEDEADIPFPTSRSAVTADEPMFERGRRAVGDGRNKIDIPTKGEIRKVIAEHPLVGFIGKVKRAFLVGSFAKGSPHDESDVDILFEVPPRKGMTSDELEEKYRQKLRQHFVKNNIRGKADHVHPQWNGRRVDLYFTYDADAETRPKVELTDDAPMFQRSGQPDLFGDDVGVKNMLKRVEAEKDRRRNSGQESLETGRADDLFSQARNQDELFKREPTGGDQVKPLAYASGMSRKGDLKAAIESPAGVGTVITELSKPGMRQVVDAVKDGKEVFVDSGAFAAFKAALKAGRLNETRADFNDVLSRYDELAKLLEETEYRDRGLVMFVAPDVVGDQTATLELLEQHAERVMAWMDKGIEVIVPFQKGPLKQSEMYKRVAEILQGTGFVVGIPSNAEALSSQDLAELLRQPYKPDRLHILGAVNSRRMDERMAIIREEYVDEVPGVTADANLIRSKMDQVIGLSGKARAEAVKKIIAEATASKQQPMFERVTDPSPKLSVLHNLDPEALIWNDEMGGIPSPSIAIVKDDNHLSGFGSITLIGTRELADPRNTDVYDADAYSPRVPRPEFTKVRSTKKVQEFVNALRPYENKFDDHYVVDRLWDNAVNGAKPYDTISSFDRSEPVMAYWLEKEKGIKVEPVMIPREPRINFAHMPAWTEYMGTLDRKRFNEEGSHSEFSVQERVRALAAARKALEQWLSQPKEKDLDDDTNDALNKLFLEGFNKHVVTTFDGVEQIAPYQFDRAREDYDKINDLVVDKSATRDLVKEKIGPYQSEFQKWVNSSVLALYGPPHVTVGKKKLPYTLENIVEAMTIGRVKGAEKGMTFGEGKARAHASKMLTSLEHMRNSAASGMGEPEEVHEKREAAKKKLEAWRDQVIKYYKYENTWSALDDSMKAMARWATTGRTVNNLRKQLARLDFANVPPYVLEEGVEAGKAMMEAPVPYFEGKPARAVRLNEFVGAVIPENTPPEAIAVLDRNGIPWRKYGTEYDDVSRRKALAEFRRELAQAGKDVMFRRAAAARKPGALHERSVRAEVNRILAAFATRPRLMVVQTHEQLPQGLKDAIRERGGTLGSQRAIQWQGGIYFIADQYTELADVMDSVLHETVVHFGLRTVIDPETHYAILDGIARDQEAVVRKMGRLEFGDKYDHNNTFMRRIAAEEVLAYYAPDYIKGRKLPGKLEQWVKAAIDAIKAFIAKLVGSKPETLVLPDDYNREAMNRIIDALELYLKRGRGPDYVETADQAAMAETRTVQMEDGTRRPITDANGKLVAETVEQQRNFWRWFGDSKVVDDHGRPLRVYHGSPNMASFSSFSDEFGEHFFTTDAQLASGYAVVGARGKAGVVPAYLALKNPYVVDAKGNQWHEIPSPDWDGLKSTNGIAQFALIRGHDGVIIRSLVDPPLGTHDPGTYPPSDIFIAFRANQIKSASGNRGTFDPRYTDIVFERSLPAPMFFSALTRAAEQSKTAKAPAQQWIATLRNTPGVKEEEIVWSGVEDWLKSLGRPATRDELVSFLRANEVQVEEALKGGGNPDTNEGNRLVVELTALGYQPTIEEHSYGWEVANIIRNSDEAYFRYEEMDGEFVRFDDDGERMDKFSQMPEEVQRLAMQLYRAVEDRNRGIDDEAEYGTKYSSYALRGGENYRELLLTMPINTKTHQVFEVKTGKVVDSFDTSEEAAADALRRGPRYDSDTKYSHRNPNVFRSAHWDEANILAHVRFDERTDADGKRVLFIQEIQSDWHQAGRKKGYRTPALQTEVDERHKAYTDALDKYSAATVALSDYIKAPDFNVERANQLQQEQEVLGDALKVARDRHYALRPITLSNMVPDAPMKTTWPEFAFKRMLRWAAENGFDRVAWTTGKQQNERYSLSNVAEGVSWGPLDYTRADAGRVVKIDIKNSINGIELDVDSDGMVTTASGLVRDRDEVIGAHLSEVIGADLAQQIMERPSGEVNSLEMEVGGEGMRGFYDKMLPAMVSRLTKKWGGKVSTTTLWDTPRGVSGPGGFSNADNFPFVVFTPAGNEYNRYETREAAERDGREMIARGGRVEDQSGDRWRVKVHSVDVTPQMRDAALAGQPMFQQNPSSVGAAIARQLKPGTPQRKGYAALADRIINAWNRKIGGKYGALGNLPEAKQYLIHRYRTLGGLSQVREVTKGIYETFSAATAEDSKAVYEYLTTAGAQPDGIADEKVRAKAIAVKDMIDAQGQALVQAGLLPEESYEKYKDQYLPRLYLRHVLDDGNTGKMSGAGKRLSDQGYLKARKDIPEEVRKVILGEITDPAFLGSFAIGKVQRDLHIMSFLQTIAQNAAWTPPQMLVDWDGRKVSAFWLQAEAKQLRLQADHMRPRPDLAAKARAIADKMDSLANAALAAVQRDVDLTDFEQIPDSARYGALRGLYVRKEIHEDLVGAYNFVDSSNMTGFAGVLERTFGQGGALTKATQMWKTSKVALNAPSHIRNMVGNLMMLHLSGVPAYRLPDRLVMAINSVVTKDRWYQIARKYGLEEATFANRELMRVRDEWVRLQKTKGAPWNRALAMLGQVTDTVGGIYQFEEALFKIMKLQDAMDREGMSEADAMIEAHKWVFDYSLVPRWVRYLRNAPFGLPFLSYTYFAAPRLLETAVRRPWKFLPYIALMYALQEAFLHAWGGDDDDVEQLKKSFPAWMNEKGSLMLLPYKDANGNWQVLDWGYMVPWGQFQDTAIQASHGNLRQSADTLGILSGPIPDLVSVWQTGIDPFTQKPIAAPGDPPAQQVKSYLTYLWGMAAPGFITDTGALGKIKDAYSGKVNARTGEPAGTKGQAWGRLFGFNVYPVDPQATRETNLFFMQKDIDEARMRLRQKLRDKNLDDEARAEIRRVHQKHIDELVKKRQEYDRDSRIPSHLRKERDLTSSVESLLEGKSKQEVVQALRDAGYPAFASLIEDMPAKPRRIVQESLASMRA